MRLIDADALKEELCKEYRHFGERTRENFPVFRLLRDAPTIDAVAVVRCKECKSGRPYKYTTEYVACEVDCEAIDRDGDFYCADGKRRE